MCQESNQGLAVDPADLHGSFCASKNWSRPRTFQWIHMASSFRRVQKRFCVRHHLFPAGRSRHGASFVARSARPEVTDAKAFAGCWNNIIFCLQGRGVEIFVDQYSMALTGQVKIYASLLADVGGALPERVCGDCAGDGSIKSFFACISRLRLISVEA